MTRISEPARRPPGAGLTPLAGGTRLWVAAGLVLLGAVLVVAWLVLRAGSVGEAAVLPGPPADADTVTYELRGEGAPVRVEVEVAATPEERRRGLSNRERVPAGTGMVFLFPEDSVGPFWMKDTLVPLSIAYVAADGRVVSVHEMTPCEADPCPLYEPEGPYRSALELPAGAIAAAGVGPGDLVVPVAPDELPKPS